MSPYKKQSKHLVINSVHINTRSVEIQSPNAINGSSLRELRGVNRIFNLPKVIMVGRQRADSFRIEVKVHKRRAVFGGKYRDNAVDVRVVLLLG